MRIANKKDRDLVVDILSTTFRDNPSVHNIVKRVDDKHIMRLMEYAFDSVLETKGVYISDDNRGVAICYQPSLQLKGLWQFWLQLKLTFCVIGVFNILKALKHKELILSQHPKDGNYLNFWFLGVLPQTNIKSVLEIKRAVFKESQMKGLPIYIETSVEKNKRVYQRYGFEVYHKVPLGEEDLYFLRKLGVKL